MRMLVALMIAACPTVTFADATKELHRIIDDHWRWYLVEHPRNATSLGIRSGNDRWNDMSLQALAARYTSRGEYLQRLQRLDRNALGTDDRLNYDLLKRRLQLKRGEHELGLDLMKMNMRTGPQHRYTLLERTPLDTEQDYRMLLARLAALPELLQQYTELLREGMRRDRVQARVVMERVPAQIARISDGEPETSPYYKPFLQRPDGIDPGTFGTIRAQAADIIGRHVNPAYQRFGDFIERTYLPACREQPGVSALPGGKALYEFKAREYTTTELTPKEIHAIGKQEVARILAEMEAVKAETGFDGNLEQFNDFLRTDPQFYYDTPEDLLEGYQALSKRLDPELVKLFGRLPRTPYGVRPIPAELAPDTTTAYYNRPALDGSRAGYYSVNLYKPEVRPKYEMEVLSVHEAVPGHHLQIALAQEIEGLPPFRTNEDVTAFVEGWALYSERLGYQMGLYQDPYSRYGQLTYDMWRAVRLVVDTGIHYMGWSRQQAIDYFKANAGKTEADIVNEIDRYIGWPGQALAYKIGQLKILELRAEAEQALGADFDIRTFHDELLGAGAIPLQLLEQRMDTWLAAQQSS